MTRSLSSEEAAYLSSILGGMWYDRPESDELIAKELVELATEDELKRLGDLLARLLTSSAPPEDRAGLIRRSVWRHFDDPIEGPLAWAQWLSLTLTRQSPT